MNSMKILFTADCHIKRRTWTNSTLLQGDAYQALGKVISAVAGKSDMVGILLGGDLFDSNRPTSTDILTVKDYLCNNFDTCYYINGNHDSVEPSYLAAMTGSVEDDYFHLVRLDDVHAQLDLHVSMAGISWKPSATETWEAIRQIVKDWRQVRTTQDDILYIVMHASFQHLLGFDGAYDITADMIKDLCGDDHINFLVGHIHTRDTLVYNSKGAYIHSPGSLYPLSADKMGEPCYASLIDINTGAIEDISADVRQYLSLNIGLIGAVTPIAWLDANGHAPQKGMLPTFVRLVIPEGYDKPLPSLEDPRYVFKVERQIAQAQPTAAVESSYSISQAIKDELADHVNREMALDMAEEIISSDDPIETINKWLEFWGVKKC